jgi:hypothetical protein
MSYEFYKIVHLTGVFMVLTAVGAHLLNGFNGGTKEFTGRKFVGMMHGLGLLVSLVGGFGLIARLGLNDGWPGWIFLKLGIWLFFGVVIILPRKTPQWTNALWVVVIGVSVLAVYLVQYKPF